MQKYAFMLENGDGVDEDMNESICYLKMAISKERPDAMLHYAMLNYEGKKIQQNYEEAARYFKMAANYNLPFAKYYYVVMLLHDFGVEADMKEACRYLKLAADEGIIKASKEIISLIWKIKHVLGFASHSLSSEVSGAFA